MLQPVTNMTGVCHSGKRPCGVNEFSKTGFCHSELVSESHLQVFTTVNGMLKRVQHDRKSSFRTCFGIPLIGLYNRLWDADAPGTRVPH